MSDIMNMAKREEKRPYAKFVVKPEEVNGKFENVEYVHITPAYTKDIIVKRVDAWLAKLKQQAKAGRCPQEWISQYKEQYDLWKEGLEPPLEGTPIRGWPALDPAMQEHLVSIRILTVEDLAGANEDALRRIGMGGVTLKNRAAAYLKAAKDVTPVVRENATLKAELDLAKKNVETLSEQLSALKEFVKANLPATGAKTVDVDPDANAISASDLLSDEDEPQDAKGRKKRGE